MNNAWDSSSDDSTEAPVWSTGGGGNSNWSPIDTTYDADDGDDDDDDDSYYSYGDVKYGSYDDDDGNSNYG